MTDENWGGESFRLSRRSVISAALAAAGGAQAFGQVASAPAAAPSPVGDKPARRYDMRKSINLWAFPYPDKMSSSNVCNWPTTPALTPSS